MTKTSASRTAQTHPRPDKSTESSARAISRGNTAESPVVRHLQRQVANAFVLYANFKRYHWQVKGPLFRDYHRLFDELAGDVLQTLDELAERLRMIGQDPIATPAEVLEATSVKPAELGQSLREMVESADTHAIQVIREMREAIQAAESADDPGTADVLVRFVQVHEKHEWWLRDLLEEGDGLVT
jgi:starvation-inducible DNA-binding protein